ncbi:DUF6230 family protein [Actinocrinis puniceicyclus]|uniref:DUF6230 family protein n=1 Tax=Actinocrinis puniceicyclus TaxID=977794 RepID=UPI001FE443F2|nr:DUF6230 family protein [Actinocrinis puniceicyclus]
MRRACRLRSARCGQRIAADRERNPDPRQPVRWPRRRRSGSAPSGRRLAGPLGDFAQQPRTVDISNLRQDGYATTAASFSLPGLSMSSQNSGC